MDGAPDAPLGLGRPGVTLSQRGPPTVNLCMHVFHPPYVRPRLSLSLTLIYHLSVTQTS